MVAAGCGASPTATRHAPGGAGGVHPIACPVPAPSQQAVAEPTEPVRPGLATELVPAGPTYATICRYSGLNPPPDPQTLVGVAEVVGPRLGALVAFMDSPDRQVIHNPEYFNCPSDDGRVDLVEFFYTLGPAARVWVDVTGCRFASNGVRTVAGYSMDRRLATLAEPSSAG